MFTLIRLALISLDKYAMHDYFHRKAMPSLLPAMYTETRES